MAWKRKEGKTGKKTLASRRPRAITKKVSEARKSAGTRSRVRRFRLAIGLVGFLFLTTILFAAVYRFSAVFSIPHPIRAIEIRTNGTLPDSFIQKVLGLETAKDLGSLNVCQLRQRLLKLSQVREVRIDRVYPDRLRIRVEEHLPVFRIPYEEGRFCLLASDGSIFESLSLGEDRLQELPILRGIDLSEGRKKFLTFGKDLAQFWSASRRFSPQLVRQWKAVLVDEKAFDLSGKLDSIEIQSSSVKHLLLDPTASQRQLEELVYILDEARRKHLLPLLKVDLTVENHAFVKPMR